MTVDVGMDGCDGYEASATMSKRFEFARVQQLIEAFVSAITQHLARDARAHKQPLGHGYLIRRGNHLALAYHCVFQRMIADVTVPE